MVSPLLTSLLRAVVGHPDIREVIARIVADEDTVALSALLQRLGLHPTRDELEDLLDEPGPFRPAVRGWT